MADDFDPYAILAQIGFEQVEELQRIYKWSPVFRFVQNGDAFVLKKTIPKLEHALQLFSWQKHLQDLGLRVVQPTKAGEAYLRTSEAIWVVYPFVDGEASEQWEQRCEYIFNAGELLGGIHDASHSSPVRLRSYKWPEHKPESVQDDLEALARIPISNEDLGLATIKSLLNEHIEREKKLRNAGLPCVNATWDFKRNNLVFQDKIPTLVDLDSSGFIPRIFDFAIAILLFNNELPSAAPPAAPFHQSEFQQFFAGYSKRCNLSPFERQNWNEALKFIYVEECLWALLNNDADAWKQMNQGHFLKELLSLPSRFADFSLPI